MNKLWIVFRYELRRVIEKRAWQVITLLLVAAILIGLSFPRFTGAGEEAEQAAADVTTLAALLHFENPDDQPGIGSLLRAAMPQVLFQQSESGGETLDAAVLNGSADFALDIRSALDYDYIVGSGDRYGETEMTIAALMTQAAQSQQMVADGLTPEQAQAVLTATPQAETRRLGEDPWAAFMSAYVVVFLLYMAIALYGNMVASGVGAEKSTRAMELLITSAKPTDLIFGKVLGMGSAALLQLLLVLVAGKIGYHLNLQYWVDSAMISAIFGMSAATMAYMLVFFVLGFFLYAFLYAAVGSLVSSTEELSSAIMPVTMLYIVVFVVVISGTTAGVVDSGAMLVASFIPLSSPMAMFARIVMGHPATWEIILSIALLAGGLLLVGYAASGIYQLGVLLYGQKADAKTLWRAIRRQAG